MHAAMQIHTTYDVFLHSRFFNLGASNRGAIRKAPSALSFVYGLRSLNTSSPEDILRSWNSTCPKCDQITGRKSMVVQLLLNLKKDLLEKLQTCVSLFGWEQCPFSDDSLSSRKIYPGGSFRSSKVAKTSAWFSRLQVTEDSYELFVDMVTSQHSATAVGCRAKLSKSTVEDKAEICACAVHMAQEMLRTTPNCTLEVQEFLVCKGYSFFPLICVWGCQCTGISENDSRWLQRFAQGDNGAEMEVAAAVTDKSDTYTLRDNPSFLAGLASVCACVFV